MSSPFFSLTPTESHSEGSKRKEDDTTSPSLLSIRSEVSTPRQGAHRNFQHLKKPQIPGREQGKLPSIHIPCNTPITAKLSMPPTPVPKPPSKCPLFCCFYAEFDNKVGPKVSYQAPRHFMSEDIQIPLERVHSILGDFSERFQKAPPSLHPSSLSALSTSLNSASDHAPRPGDLPPTGLHHNESIASFPSMAAGPSGEDDTFDPIRISEGSSSIFDSCSEFIITGPELSGKIVNLSTHNIHSLTRPTNISNKRYERNSLLFCVGFVVRRTEDPSPFRPVLFRLADALRDMEVESRFLSSGTNNAALQALLEWCLMSLNSVSWECNLCVNPSNVLHLKLFHPPRRPPKPVPNHAVPIFLRRDWQLQNCEWDLAINWVCLHIDGATNSKKISQKAEIDMEMVQACLRVLQHHQVIALVDMFFYSNRYESTEKAAAMLCGRENKLLQEAADFVIRRPANTQQQQQPPTTESASPMSGSPLQVGRLADPQGSRGDAVNPHQFLAHSGSLRFNSSFISQGSQADQLGNAARRLELREVYNAVAELYVACHRGTSIGELLLNLARGTQPAGMPADIVNWRKVLSMIDHRRFVSFGRVHGLLKRVHDYPFHKDSGLGRPRDEMSSVGSTHARGSPLTPVRGEKSPLRPNSRLDTTRDNNQRLRTQVAAAMDGKRCDDELVCLFEKPYSELLGLLENDKILHLYA